jgi:hypothetical protein
MEIRNHGPADNPILKISADEVHRWLREQADRLGYKDRAILAIQLMVEQPFGDGMIVHNECPALAVMLERSKP